METCKSNIFICKHDMRVKIGSISTGQSEENTEKSTIIQQQTLINQWFWNKQTNNSQIITNTRGIQLFKPQPNNKIVSKNQKINSETHFIFIYSHMWWNITAGQLLKTNKYKTKAQQMDWSTNTTSILSHFKMNVIHKHWCSVNNVFYAA